MTLSRRPLALASPLLAALALVACGGSGDDETTGGNDDFAAAADQICIDEARRDIAARHTTPNTVAYLRRLQKQRRETVTELDALDSAPELADRFDEYIAQRRQAAARIGDGIGAAEAEDSNALEGFRVAARKRVLAAQRLAAELGLTACAGILPADERAEVEAAIALSTEPSRAREFCRDHVSEAMLDANFGSLAKCIREQSRRSATESVAIDELSGVTGVSADAIVSLDTGDERAGSYEAALVHERGSWRMDAVSSRPEA